MSRLSTKLILGAAAVAWSSQVMAQRLGTGSAPEVSIVRTIGALIVCLLIAGLAILYLKHRSGARLPMFNRLIKAHPELDVRELRRLTVQHSLALVRHGGHEYLLVLSPGDTLLLSDRPVGDGTEEPAA